MTSAATILRAITAHTSGPGYAIYLTGKLQSKKKLVSFLNICVGHPDIGVSIGGNGGCHEEDRGKGLFTYTFCQCPLHGLSYGGVGKELHPEIFSSLLTWIPIVRRYFTPREAKESEPKPNSFDVYCRFPNFRCRSFPKPQLSSIYIKGGTLFLATSYPLALNFLSLSRMSRPFTSKIMLNLVDRAQSDSCFLT